MPLEEDREGVLRPYTLWTQRDCRDHEDPRWRKALLVANFGGRSLHRKSRESLMHAAWRWGAEYVEWTAPVEQCKHHLFKKAALLGDESLKAFDRVAYFDADTIVRIDTPSPFGLAPQDSVGGCREFHGRSWFDWWCGMDEECVTEAARIDLPPTSYFGSYINTGMMLLTPEIHCEVWREVAAREYPVPRGGSGDQVIFNTLAYNGHAKVQVIHSAYNTLIGSYYRQLPDDHTGYRKGMSTWVLHLAGRRPRRRILNKLWWRCGNSSPQMLVPFGCKVDDLPPTPDEHELYVTQSDTIRVKEGRDATTDAN